MPADSSGQRKVLRDFLSENLDAGTFPGVSWISKEERLFRIPWLHKAKRNWTEDHGMLFKAWSQYTGNYKESDNAATLKTRLRCALSKSMDVEYRKDLSSNEDENCYRVYQLKERKPPKRLLTEPIPDYPLKLPPKKEMLELYSKGLPLPLGTVPLSVAETEDSVDGQPINYTKNAEGMDTQTVHYVKCIEVPEAGNYEEINIGDEGGLQSQSPETSEQPITVVASVDTPMELGGSLPAGAQRQDLYDNKSGAPVLMELATIITDRQGEKTEEQVLTMPQIVMSRPNYYNIPPESLPNGRYPYTTVTSVAPEPKNVTALGPPLTISSPHVIKHVPDVNVSRSPAYSTSSEGPSSDGGHPTSAPGHQSIKAVVSTNGHQSNSFSIQQATPSTSLVMNSQLPAVSPHSNYMIVFLHYDGKQIKESPYRNICTLRVRDSRSAPAPKDRNSLELPPCEDLKLGEKAVSEIKVLSENLKGGITIHYQDGDIFATRHCLSHAFYSNFFEAQRSIKLERGKETQIFSMRSFQLAMEEMSSGGKAPSSMVYIGIGRKWFFCDLESQQRPAAPISLCVKSFRAYDMLQQKKMDNLDQDECTSSLQSLQISSPDDCPRPQISTSADSGYTSLRHEESMVL